MRRGQKPRSRISASRYAARLGKCLLTLLCLACWPSLSGSAELPEITLRRVPPGYVTAEEGYLANEEALRTIYSAIRTYREERDAWENAYYELKAESGSYAEDMKASLAGLRRDLEDERAAWRQSIRRARSPGFGVFGGVGYTGSGFGPVIGIGMVRKIF